MYQAGSDCLFRRQAHKTHEKWGLEFVRCQPRPSRAATEAVTQQRPDSQPPIRVTNLFAFSGRAWHIGNGNLGNLLAHPAELRSHFGAKLKTLARQTNLRDQGTPEDFVTSRFIVDPRSIQQIGEMRQKLCAQEKSQPALRPVWTHAVDDVRLASFQRLQQRRIVLRIVLEV